MGLLIVITGILLPGVVHAAGNPLLDAVGDLFQITGNVTFGPLFASSGYILMTLSSMILIFSGWILDNVIQYTILEVSGNLGNTKGMGGAITEVWTTIRDIANMCFIFVLLFAAFKAMFDTNFGNFNTTVKNIIIVALLINFSLFFSKVVIDASNIVSVGFYKAIATNNAKLTGSGVLPGGTANFKGISGGYMRMLGLQTWYSSNVLQNGFNAQNILVTGIMSSIFMLISAVIFLMIGIMFVSRFILLTFLMILSPLALVAFAIPGMKSQFDKWLSSLIEQSFFAPLFFALTWVSFKLGNALITTKVSGATWIDLMKNMTTNKEGGMVLVLNYVLVTGFSITALFMAKTLAKKTPFFTNISSGVGSVAIGGTALVARNLVGRKAANVMRDTDLQERAARGDIGARMKLATAYKFAGSSFDVRGIADTKYGKQFGASTILDNAGKAGGAGGFTKVVKDKAEREAKYAKEIYGQTDEEKEEVERLKREEKNTILGKRDSDLVEAEAGLTEAEKERRDYLKKRTEEEQADYDAIKREKKEKETKLASKTDEKEKNKIRKELQDITIRMANSRAILDEKKKDTEENNDEYGRLKIVATDKKTLRDKAKNKKDQKDISDEEYSSELQSKMGTGKQRMRDYAETIERGPFNIGWIGKMQGNRAAAIAVRKAAGEKTKAEKLAEAAVAYQKDLASKEGSAASTSATTPPTNI